MDRAYSFIEVRAINDDDRTIEGVASTPSVDRVGDILESLGAEFTLPMPLLWQHRSDEPVGWVEYAKPTKKGIPFKARFAKIADPGALRDMVEKAWQATKAKLVGAVSVGFKIKDWEPIDAEAPWKGWRIKAWEWLELSLVTIPANPDATITSIRSIVTRELAAAGREAPTSERRAELPATRRSSTPAIRGKPMAKKTIAEQISAFESTRTQKAERMQEIMEGAAERGETLNPEEQQEYDEIIDELKAIDDHIKRLRTLEEMNVGRAIPVAGQSESQAVTTRTVDERGGLPVLSRGQDLAVARERGGWPVVAHVRDQLPKGQAFVNAFIAMASARIANNGVTAAQIAKARWPDHPEIEGYINHKVAVAAGTTTGTTWASPLVVAENLASEFAELLRPQTIIGRIPGLRRVPFNIKVPRQTGGATVNWVGEGAPKPLSALAFDQVTLAYTKLAGIIAMTQELVRFSQPSAEAIVRQDLSAAIVQMMDRDFVDPTKAAVAGVSPASITNGVTPVTATGTTAAALRADVGTLIDSFLNNNYSLSGAIWLMNETQAMRISMMRTALDQPEFPGVSATGGTFVGLPLITAENIPDVGDSPANGSRIILLKANEIMLADDGDVDISVSDQASLQMESAPDSPPTGTTVFVSLWQQNMMAVKAERFINWTKRRSTAVGYINAAKYVG